MKKKCRHNSLKVRKHREDPYPCLHCLDCNATWSNPVRALSFLKTKLQLIGINKIGERSRVFYMTQNIYKNEKPLL